MTHLKFIPIQLLVKYKEVIFMENYYGLRAYSYEGHSEIIDSPLPERKPKIYSSTEDPIILMSSLWKFNHSLNRFNQTERKNKLSF